MTKEQYIKIDEQLESMYEAATKLEEDMSLSDMAQMHIADWRDVGVSDEEIFEKLRDMYGYDNHLSSEEVELFDRRNDPETKEAASGDIEDEYMNMRDEGFGNDEVLKQLQALYDYSYSELKSIIGDYWID